MENNDKTTIDLNNNEATEIKSNESAESHHSHSSEHHHHHSHHHSHHSSKRKHRNSKTEKAKRFLKRNKYRIANIVVAVMFVAILAVLGVVLDNRGFSESGNDAESNAVSDGVKSTDSSIQIEIPLFEEEVITVNSAVSKYLESDLVNKATDIYNDYAAFGRLDEGLPVTLWYNVKGIPVGYSVRSAELYVSENNDFTSPIVFSLGSDETSVDVYNLKTDTQYYYRFVLSLSNGLKSSIDGSFKTADTPRMLSVDGVYNIRDIGGWRTVDGKTIKQGLLYRSTELDGAVESKYSVTTDGVNTLLTVLGIRTDMDLRYETDTNGTDALGASVKHTYYKAPMYSEVFTDSGKSSIKKVFSDLANKSNYPVLLHCSHGMDRTGTVCYLLEALLGVSEDDLMRDYQLSAFYHGELWGLDQMNEFIGGLKSYEGATTKEKAESYLLSIGVTQSEIESIREIFLSE